jgi:hypothetical protein
MSTPTVNCLMFDKDVQKYLADAGVKSLTEEEIIAQRRKFDNKNRSAKSNLNPVPTYVSPTGRTIMGFETLDKLNEIRMKSEGIV